MEWITVGVLVLLSLSVSTSGDKFDQLAPAYLERITAIREVSLPFSEDSIQEALFHIGSYYIPVDGIDQLCRNHSNYMLESFLKFELWAVRMVDAASKIPSGMIDGHVMDLGSFDQCLSVVAPEGMFRGQYCTVETKGLLVAGVDELNPKLAMYPTIRFDAMFSLCVPSTCSYEDVMAHMNVAFEALNGTALMMENSCTTSVPDPFTVGDWAATILIVLLFLLVILGTVYDNKYETDKNAYLTAFSLTANIPKMLDTETKSGTITCLNGLRVVSFSWVLLGHTLLVNIAYPNVRPRAIFEQFHSLGWAPLENGLLSVDIFFFMTGVLATYGYLKYRQRGKVSLVHFYLLRYLRMTPALAFIVMITATIGIRFTDGPLWKRLFGVLQSYCHNTWWHTLLYVHNYSQPLKLCVPQTWYLAADFQLYAIAPLLLIPLHKRPKLGMVLTAVFLVMTTVAGLWNAYSLELRAGGAVTHDRRTDYTMLKDYLVTHVRAATFIMGVAMGFLLFNVKEGRIILKISKTSLWAGWLMSIFFMLFSVLFVNHFQQEDYVYNRWLEMTYQVLHRHVFILGISWVVLVCALGYGGFVDKFLSWKAFVPLARLTYSAFLLHILILFMVTLNSRAPETSSSDALWHEFFGNLALSYLSAVVLFLLVECPCANLVRVAFEGQLKPKEALELPHKYTATVELPVYKENHTS